MSIIKLPFTPSKAAQATVAFLGAVGAIGTQALHLFGGVLSPTWTAAITSGLAIVAALAGFVKTAEPLIDELDKYAT